MKKSLIYILVLLYSQTFAESLNSVTGEESSVSKINKPKQTLTLSIIEQECPLNLTKNSHFFLGGGGVILQFPDSVANDDFRVLSNYIKSQLTKVIGNGKYTINIIDNYGMNVIISPKPNKDVLNNLNCYQQKLQKELDNNYTTFFMLYEDTPNSKIKTPQYIYNSNLSYGLFNSAAFSGTFQSGKSKLAEYSLENNVIIAESDNQKYQIIKGTLNNEKFNYVMLYKESQELVPVKGYKLLIKNTDFGNGAKIGTMLETKKVGESE